MTNPTEYIPEITPQPVVPEIERDKKVPIEVIDGALERFDREEEVTPEIKKSPTIH